MPVLPYCAGECRIVFGLISEESGTDAARRESPDYAGSDVSGYVRTKGFDKIQQHQMVLSALAAQKDKRITREDVAELCKITPAQAYCMLKKMFKTEL